MVNTQSLKQRMTELIPGMRKDFQELKKQYGDKELGTISTSSVSLLWRASSIRCSLCLMSMIAVCN